MEYIVENIDGLFYGCSSLNILPNISKWNTKNIISMKELFYGCSSLAILPDLSNWNINKIKYINDIISEGFSQSSIINDLHYSNNDSIISSISENNKKYLSFSSIYNGFLDENHLNNLSNNFYDSNLEFVDNNSKSISNTSENQLDIYYQNFYK